MVISDTKVMQTELNILGRRNPLKNRSKPTEAKIEEPVKEAEVSAKPKSKSNRLTFQLNKFVQVTACEMV